MPQNTSKAAVESSGVFSDVKKNLSRAADLTSLRLRIRKTAAARKDAYTRLGELSYAKYRPRETAVPADIEEAIAATVKEITDLSHELTELKLRLELLKTDAGK